MAMPWQRAVRIQLTGISLRRGVQFYNSRMDHHRPPHRTPHIFSNGWIWILVLSSKLQFEDVLVRDAL